MAAFRHAEERAPRILVSLAAIAVVAIDVLYLSLVSSQGGAPSDQPLVVPFVAGYLAVSALELIVSVAVPPAPRVALRAGAAGGLLVLAVLSGFSIGAAVLVAAGLSIAATAITLSRSPNRRVVFSALTGCVVGIAVLAGGLWVSWSYVQCPIGEGSSSGTTATYTFYTCSNGAVTIAP